MPVRTAVITGLGMASTLGPVATAVAAIRAGISRAHAVEGQQLEPDNPMPVPLIGHPMTGVTDGSYFIGRWICLACAALRDLRDYARLPEPEDLMFWRRTGLIVAVPDDIDDRYLVPDPIDDEYLMSKYIGKLVALARLPLKPPALRLSRKGHAGVIHGLEQARADIEQGTLDRVLVLGADSFVERTSLQWLEAGNRLKTADWPVGVIPGEAAACVLVEAEPAAAARGARVEATLTAAMTLDETDFDRESGRGLGRALARVAEAALRGSGAHLPFAGDLLCDLNGLESTAFDVGVMLALLNPGVISPSVRVQTPAVAIGETGAASGGVAVAVAVRAFVRGYARADLVLVTSRNADGQVGAACLGRLAPRREGRR